MVREFEKGLLDFRLSVFVVIIMACAAIWHFYQRWQMEAEERNLLISWCSSKENFGSCKEQMAVHHKRCFKSNYRPGGKYEPASLNRFEYRLCVEQGYKQWNIERIKKNKEQQMFLQEIL